MCLDKQIYNPSGLLLPKNLEVHLVKKELSV